MTEQGTCPPELSSGALGARAPRGIARALFRAAEDLARSHGRAFLELQTRIELLENHATFSALGFEKVAETAHPGHDRPTSITMRRRVPGRAG